MLEEEKKIEVGEYVRTDRGIIAKVDEIRLGTNREKKIFQNIYELDNGMWTVIDYIIKHFKNIINLIEVDDYVNRHRVISVDEENDLIYCDTKGYETPIHSKEIKEILTKEVYLDNCYRVTLYKLLEER